MTANRVPHLVWVTNIPTPYRNHRYRVFSRLLPAMGLTFEVAFMARTEPERHWQFTAEEMNYPHRFFRGAHPQIREVSVHANPGLVSYVRRRKPDLLVLGGYSAPTLVALALAPPRQSRVLLATESPAGAPFRRTGGPVVAVKRRVVGRCAGYIVPGPRSRSYLEEIDPGVTGKPVLQLPNIVDQALYRDGVDRLRPQRDQLRAELGIAEQEVVWLIPARLHPIKGLDRFLPLFAGMRDTRVMLAGDGPERRRLEEICRSSDVPATFLGTADEQQLVRLYAIADVFALPSLQDASPLSAVEALAAGLPVLLSERAGNVDEVVQPSNGWRYDPDRPDDMAPLVRSISAMPRSELAAMGRESLRVHTENFDSERWVTKLGTGLLAMAEAGPPR
ncbi:hypothetical protein KRMM14A1259_34260 [Krasilnikovia sp. MM14-A1259]